MAFAGLRWDVVIECRACRQKFQIHGVEHERIAWLPVLTPCPHCNAKSIRTGENRSIHRLVELKLPKKP